MVCGCNETGMESGACAEESEGLEDNADAEALLADPDTVLGR